MSVYSEIELGKHRENQKPKGIGTTNSKESIYILLYGVV